MYVAICCQIGWVRARLASLRLETSQSLFQAWRSLRSKKLGAGLRSLKVGCRLEKPES